MNKHSDIQDSFSEFHFTRHKVVKSFSWLILSVRRNFMKNFIKRNQIRKEKKKSISFELIRLRKTYKWFAKVFEQFI